MKKVHYFVSFDKYHISCFFFIIFNLSNTYLAFTNIFLRVGGIRF